MQELQSKPSNGNYYFKFPDNKKIAYCRVSRNHVDLPNIKMIYCHLDKNQIASNACEHVNVSEIFVSYGNNVVLNKSTVPPKIKVIYLSNYKKANFDQNLLPQLNEIWIHGGSLKKFWNDNQCFLSSLNIKMGIFFYGNRYYYNCDNSFYFDDNFNLSKRQIIQVPNEIYKKGELSAYYIEKKITLNKEICQIPNNNINLSDIDDEIDHEISQLRNILADKTKSDTKTDVKNIIVAITKAIVNGEKEIYIDKISNNSVLSMVYDKTRDLRKEFNFDIQCGEISNGNKLGCQISIIF